MVYIVMTGTSSSYSYDGVVWNIDRVFSSKQSAEQYIQHKKITHGSDVEYSIETEEVYA